MGRKRYVLILVYLLYLSTFFFPVQSWSIDQKTRQSIEQEIEKYRAEIIKIRRFIHMNPEVSNREFETAKLVASKLSSLGLEVKTGIARTGVVGLLRGNQPGPTVAIRADMDALPIQEHNTFPYRSLNPGVMHACGHDIHTSIALGTAMVLSSLKDRIKGNIKFIFQPAEEGPPPDEEGGASLMIKEGVLDNPPVRAIFALHVWPDLEVGKIGYNSGYFFASSDNFVITIKGKSAHGARPQEGIDAIVVAGEIITGLQVYFKRALDPSEPLVVTVGKIQGGNRSNIIADRVVMEGTVRTIDEQTRSKVAIMMETFLKGITQAYGATYSLAYEYATPALYNHPDFVRVVLPGLASAVGKQNLIQIKPQMVAEDFAFFAEKIPAFMFLLGVKTPGQPSAPLHSPYFNPDEKAIPVGIRAMCHLVLNALEQQASLKSSPTEKIQ
ncbi:MAG: amidohydrolase [Candidatus Aminicenantes bacterium]|nr:amidohydrolase [Candidatus Aminicenantes bacterium]